jgi:hypothetical protein
LVLAFAPDRLPNMPVWGVSSPILGRHQFNAAFFSSLAPSTHPGEQAQVEGPGVFPGP